MARQPNRAAVRELAELSELKSLEAKVKMMRELGVVEADGIKLGPLPPPQPKEPTVEELRIRERETEERRRDIMFAATSVRPKLKVVPK